MDNSSRRTKPAPPHATLLLVALAFVAFSATAVEFLWQPPGRIARATSVAKFEELEKRWKEAKQNAEVGQAALVGRELAHRYLLENRVQESIWTLRDLRATAEADELARRLRHCLLTARVLTREPLPGVASSLRYHFEGGMSAVWKKDDPTNSLSSYRAEIMAYEVSEAFGLNVVPMTVGRTVDGVNGSLQVFIPETKSGGHVDLRYSNYYAGLETLLWLDTLVKNRDRHPQNYLFRQGHHAVGIDHGLVYRHEDRGYQRYQFDPQTWINPPAQLLPQGDALQRMKAVTASELEARIGPLVHRATIDVILEQRDRMVAMAQGEPVAQPVTELMVQNFGELLKVARRGATEAERSEALDQAIAQLGAPVQGKLLLQRVVVFKRLGHLIAEHPEKFPKALLTSYQQAVEKLEAKATAHRQAIATCAEILAAA